MEPHQKSKDLPYRSVGPHFTGVGHAKALPKEVENKVLLDLWTCRASCSCYVSGVHLPNCPSHMFRVELEQRAALHIGRSRQGGHEQGWGILTRTALHFDVTQPETIHVNGPLTFIGVLSGVNGGIVFHRWIGLGSIHSYQTTWYCPCCHQGHFPSHI